MFSWIIETKGLITKINNKKYNIKCNFLSEIEIGQSISHDWICLTVSAINSDNYEVEVMPETINKSNICNKKTWDYFNLERSIRIWDRLDGHMVQWHIDCIWKLSKVSNDENAKVLTINYDSKFSPYLVEKWSISLNWISLTLINVNDDNFQVSIIPHTWSITNLSEINIWDPINIETDIIARYILKQKT